MIPVETSIVPPGLDVVDQAEDEPRLGVHVWLVEHDGTIRSGTMLLPGHPSDLQLADAFVRCVRGCAATRGPGLAAAVGRRIQ